MLVCSVSMRPPRRTIAAGLTEAAAANDAATTGQVVFATLVDDPASVNEVVDAYLGEIMVEAASAADTIDIGLSYSAGVDESSTAADSLDGTISVIPTRSAMVAGMWPIFINPDTSRQASAPAVMINQ